MIDKFIGIDPGRMGGIVIIACSGEIVTLPMPLAGKSVDIAAVADWLRTHTSECMSVAYIEKVHSMPSQGVSSAFSFGFSVGIMHGIITTLSIPLYVVSPQTWKNRILRDSKKDKDAAIEFCRRAYPQVSLIPEGHRRPHTGIADALCIAHYAMLAAYSED